MSTLMHICLIENIGILAIYISQLEIEFNMLKCLHRLIRWPNKYMGSKHPQYQWLLQHKQWLKATQLGLQCKLLLFQLRFLRILHNLLAPLKNWQRNVKSSSWKWDLAYFSDNITYMSLIILPIAFVADCIEQRLG